MRSVTDAGCTTILDPHFATPQASETINIPLDDPIPGTRNNQIVIPKGTLLAIPLNVIHQDTQVWGPDAHIFRPERWLERKKTQLRHKHELLAFGEG
jgi:hypothetical protein